MKELFLKNEKANGEDPKGSGENTGITKGFLRKIAVYVDDMRLINNIYNEYNTFNAAINTSELNHDKLLAMVTYKNIFPRDFSELLYNRGFVCSVINNKTKEIGIKKNEIEDKLEEYKAELLSIEGETASSIDELNAMYLKTDNLLVDGKSENDFSSRLEFVSKIMAGNNLQRVEYTDSNYSSHKSFNKNTTKISVDLLMEELDKNTEYKEKKEVVIKVQENRNKELERSKKELQFELFQVETYPISELFTTEMFDKKLELYIDIKGNEYCNLLRFLISDGYIDENYDRYMNYFYDNDLKKEDTIFIRNLYAGQVLSPTYSLMEKGSIVEILGESDYTRAGILNISLFEYLLENGKDRYLFSIFSVAKQQENIEFIIDLHNYLLGKSKFSNSKKVKVWIRKLCEAWDDFYYQLLNNKHDTTVIQHIVLYGLGYLDKDAIKSQNKYSKLSGYINQNSSLFQNQNELYDNTLDNLRELKVEFTEVNYIEMSDELILSIYENNLYALNYQNIREIALYKKIISENDDLFKFKHSNLTYIMESEAEILKVRVKNGINEYMDEYLSFASAEIYDNEEIILFALNTEALERKIDYIGATKNTVKNINEVKDEGLWIELIEKKVVLPSINNIVNYYVACDKSWSQELINFVNNCDTQILVNYEEVISEFGKMNFFGNTLKQNHLLDDRYADILGKSEYKLENDNWQKIELDDSKLNILIKFNVLPMNRTNLNHIRNNHKKYSLTYIKYNFESYLKLVNSNFDENEIVCILNSDLTTIKKEQVLSKLNASKKISINSIEDDDLLLYKIIEKHLRDEDIPLLLKEYSLYTDMVKKEVIDIAVSKYQNIKNYILDKNLVIDVLQSELNITAKIELVKNKIDMLDYNNIILLIPFLNLSEKYKELSKGKRPKFKNENLNRVILKRLKEIGTISSYEKNSDGYIVARGRKTQV